MGKSRKPAKIFSKNRANKAKNKKRIEEVNQSLKRIKEDVLKNKNS